MNKECTICFEENIEIVILECNHEVCTTCKARIMQTTTKCPFCQRLLTKPAELVEVETQTQPTTIVFEPRRIYGYQIGPRCKCLIYSFVLLVIILSMNESVFRPKGKE